MKICDEHTLMPASTATLRYPSWSCRQFRLKICLRVGNSNTAPKHIISLCTTSNQLYSIFAAFVCTAFVCRLCYCQHTQHMCHTRVMPSALPELHTVALAKVFGTLVLLAQNICEFDLYYISRQPDTTHAARRPDAIVPSCANPVLCSGQKACVHRH